MNDSFDIAVIGSGFAGSLMAMIAKRLGYSVVLLERGRHPRFTIGESSTPLANLLLEELATTYDLPRLLPLTKWGSWQREYPQLACGLKRGFTFYHHRAGESFSSRTDRSNELLVAASPNDQVADTHWLRADVDHFLVKEAQSIGVDYCDEVELHGVVINSEGGKIDCTRHGRSRTPTAKFVIDAGGPNGFISGQPGLDRTSDEEIPATRSLYTHFRGVKDCGLSIKDGGNLPPYAPDNAAVHHVFEGGWVWSLRFNNGITSVGIMATEPLARELKLEEGEPAWKRLLGRFPTLQTIFADAQPVRPFIYSSGLSFRASQIAGEHWALLPSAAGFIDPLLSTGIPLTLLGIQRLAGILKNHWGSDRQAGQLEKYAGQTGVEQDTAARLIGALYQSMSDFDRFVSVSKLYFAAASFSEVARRLNRPELAGGFLMHDHPTFGPAVRGICGMVDSDGCTPESLKKEVLKAIAPIDIAGLSRTDRANWFPVDTKDTLAAVEKLDVDAAALHAMFRRCGVS